MLKDLTRDQFTRWLAYELNECLLDDSRGGAHKKHEIYLKIYSEGIPQEILDEMPDSSDAVSAIVNDVVNDLLEYWTFRETLEEKIKEDFFCESHIRSWQLDGPEISRFCEMNLSDDEISSLEQAPSEVRKSWSSCCDHLGMSENDNRRGFLNKHLKIDDLIDSYREHNKLKRKFDWSRAVSLSTFTTDQQEPAAAE